MTELDHLWQQPNGFPKAAYFGFVHDALKTIGITPESWHQGDPWEGAVVLGETALTGTCYERDDEVTVAWRVEQDCEPKHAEDFEGEGWYLVAVRGDDRNVVDLPGLSFLAEPDEVARAVARLLGVTEPAAETRQCGHDDYHDGHPWDDRPTTWCPGHTD